MATKVEDSAHPPEMVGNAFVEQYYNMLCQAPENVHKFYQNSSVVSRHKVDGSMSSVSTLDGIDKMILSLDYKNCLVEILTADSQASIGKGVIVLVTGYFTGIDGIKRKFSQLFFLVPQETNEYFVLNDVFRYVDADALTAQDKGTLDNIPTSAISDETSEPILAETDKPFDEEEEIAEVLDVGDSNDDEERAASDNTDSADRVESFTQEVTNVVQDSANQKFSQSDSLEDAPKKSYASVANALNFKKQPFQQRNSPVKAVEKTEIVAPPPLVQAPVAPPPSPPPNNNTVEKPATPTDAVKGHSIFVANLPMNATTEQLREVFGKFGAIKPDGIQVRSYRQEKNCFGFVEFESAESMHSALKVTSIMIGNRNAHIEEKKATGDGTRYSSRKIGFRSDSFKSRGNVSGRIYGRNEFENQERAQGYARLNGQGGDGNSRNYQNGGGRSFRPPHEATGPGARN